MRGVKFKYQCKRVRCNRQQREELLQKQERLDAMRKKREARPESPPQGRKQQPQRPLVRRTSFRDRQAQAAAAAAAAANGEVRGDGDTHAELFICVCYVKP